jgi:hypothetical protein
LLGALPLTYGRHVLERFMQLAAVGTIALLSTSAAAQSGRLFSSREAAEEKAEEEGDDLPRLRGKELLAEVPDLQTKPWPPPFRLGVGFVGRFPFQLLGLDLGAVAYVGTRLRSEVHYSIGYLGGRHGEAWVSHYADVTLSLRLFGVDAEREIELRHEKKARWNDLIRSEGAVYLKASVPSYHALLVDGGWMTGPVALERCEADCAPTPGEGKLTDVKKQLIYYYAGLRYVYFVYSWSKRQPKLNHRSRLQAYAQLILPPLKAPTENLWKGGSTVARSPFGVRVGVDVPLCSDICVAWGLELGYLPLPRVPIIGTSIKFVY